MNDTDGPRRSDIVATLDALADLTAGALAAADTGDDEKLAQILDQRGSVLQELSTEAETIARGSRTGLPAGGGCVPWMVRSRLADVVGMDRDVLQRLRHRRDQLAAEITKVRAGKTLVRRYGDAEGEIGV